MDESDHLAQLERLAALYEKGVLSKDEFEEQKARLLAATDVRNEGDDAPANAGAPRRPPVDLGTALGALRRGVTPILEPALWRAGSIVALATFATGLLVYSVFSDTPSGLAFRDENFPGWTWLQQAIPLGLVPLSAWAMGLGALFDAGLLAACVPLSLLLPLPTGLIVALPEVIRRLRSHGGHPGTRLEAALGLSVLALLVQLLLGIVDLLPPGDILDPHYLMTTWVLLIANLPLAVYAAGLTVAMALGQPNVGLARRLKPALAHFLGASIGAVLFWSFNPPPCRSYTSFVYSGCGSPSTWTQLEQECGARYQEILSECEEALATGSLSREAARHPDQRECSHRLAGCRDEKEQERVAELRAAIYGNRTSTVCSQCGPKDVCEALFDIKSKGRSSSATRGPVNRFLEERGYKKLWGYVIQRLDPSLYEVAWMRNTGWGYFPSDSHFVLKTNLTEYSSKGTFTLWAKKTDNIEVELTSGFDANWDVYEEDAFGSVIQGIYDAPAGDPTSNAANVAIIGLCVLQGKL